MWLPFDFQLLTKVRLCFVICSPRGQEGHGLASKPLVIHHIIRCLVMVKALGQTETPVKQSLEPYDLLPGANSKVETPYL